MRRKQRNPRRAADPIYADDVPVCTVSELRSENTRLRKTIELLRGRVDRRNAQIVLVVEQYNRAMTGYRDAVSDLARLRKRARTTRLPAARTLPHVAGFGTITVTGSEFERLKGNRWLNDTIMNAKLAMMAMKQQSRGERRVHIMNTYFWPRLDALGYDAVASWTDKMVPDDAILCDRILVPINIENEHWTLVQIDMKARNCVYFDSFGHAPEREITDSQRRVLQTLARWAELEHRKRVGSGRRSVIKKIAVWGSKPIQQNGYDCGLFVLRIAEHLTRRGWSRVCRVTQDEINTFRGDLFRELEGKRMRRACLQCGVVKTPQWRMGPHGKKTLCNACGVKHLKRERILNRDGTLSL